MADVRPSLADSWLKMVELGPSRSWGAHLVELAQKWLIACEVWSKSVELRPNLAELGPRLSEFGPSLVDVGRNLIDSGPTVAEIGCIRSELWSMTGQMGGETNRIKATPGQHPSKAGHFLTVDSAPILSEIGQTRDECYKRVSACMHESARPTHSDARPRRHSRRLVHRQGCDGLVVVVIGARDGGGEQDGAGVPGFSGARREEEAARGLQGGGAAAEAGEGGRHPCGLTSGGQTPLDVLKGWCATLLSKSSKMSIVPPPLVSLTHTHTLGRNQVKIGQLRHKSGRFPAKFGRFRANPCRTWPSSGQTRSTPGQLAFRRWANASNIAQE